VWQRQEIQELLRPDGVGLWIDEVLEFGNPFQVIMVRIHSRRIIAGLLLVALLPACEIHKRTIREYQTDPSGRTSLKTVTEEEYWKERVDERITAEVKKEKPEAGYDSWQNYWRWWYSVLRRKKKPPFKSESFKTSEDMVTYIKEKRQARGLPAYD